MIDTREGNLKPKQALLLFKLLFLGGEEPYVLENMKPRLLERASERQELIDKGLLRREERPRPAAKAVGKAGGKPRPLSVLVPTDRAWDWAAGRLSHVLPPVPRNQAHLSKLYGDLFPAMLCRLDRLVADERVSLAEFAAPEPAVLVPVSAADPVATVLDDGEASENVVSEEELVAAYCVLSAGRAFIYVRIGAMQEALLPHSWRAVNAALLRAAENGRLMLHPCDTPENLTAAERERAVVQSDVPCHVVTMEVVMMEVEP